MKFLLLLLLVSVALAAPQGEEKSPADPSPAAEEETETSEAPKEEDSATEAAPAGGSAKSTIGNQASLDKLAEEFEMLEQSGAIPVAIPAAASPAPDEKFGAKVNIFGVDVPVIILAKLGIAIVATAASAIGRGGTASAAAALGSGVSFPDASDPEAVARILRATTSSAAAIFDGDIAGEVYLAQALRPEGETAAATVITAKFSSVPAGTYRLEVRESGDVGDSCARVGPRFSTDKAEASATLCTLLVDEGGQASAILSRSGVDLTGPSSVLGRSVVLVADAESAVEPVACAVIVRQ